MPSFKFLLRTALFGLLTTTPFTSGHTWIEQLMVIAPNGTLVGEPGFARGNVLRGTPGFSDPTMVNLIPPDGRPINQIEPTDLMCKSTQTSQTQTDGSPRLQAAPGSAVALRFQENGHVTLPDNQPGKPSNRGTVYVYGTTQPSPDDSFLAIHRVWNAEGTGGDGRGVLLSTQNFDDGQCYQVNGGQISQQRQQQFKHAFNSVMGNDLWCQQDIQLPSDAPSGKPYTLYWVWDWPTMPGTAGFPDGKQEIYTTCMDVDIVDNSDVGTVAQTQAQFLQGQPFDSAAIATEFSDIANPTAVTGSSIPFSASATGPVSGAASEASVAAASSTETGVPAFLSVHTGSTAGPGIETQSFTVIPIGVSTTNAQSAQETGNSGQGHGGRGGNDNGESGLESTLSSVLSMLSSLDKNLGAQSTPIPTANAAVATFTEYESITETVYQTVYSTRYTKRDGKPTPPMFASASNLPAPGSSAGQTFPSIWPSFAPNEPHSVFRDDPRNRTCGSVGNYTGHGNPTGSRSRGHGHYGDGNPWFNSMSLASVVTATTDGFTMTAANGSMSASIMTMPDGVVMTMPATIDTPIVAPFPPMLLTLPSPSTTVYSVMPTDSKSPSLPPNSTQTSELSSLTVVPIPDSDSAPAPTLAPGIAARAASPAPVEGSSTAHSVFRLRARNPFIWLGWSLSPSQAKATPV